MCFSCAVLPASQTGICTKCRVPYQRAWCVGERHEELKKLINSYKFENARAAHLNLTALLDETLPTLPDSVHIVPIPTISSHIRQRGYDHMALIARRFAKVRQLPYTPLLRRQNMTVQRDASKKQRLAQAREAFICPSPLDSEAIYLLLDDVATTGATMKYATQALKAAGAETVWVASISRQPLD